MCAHVGFLFIDSFSGCDWTMDTWSCCSSSHLCGVMEGDCDNDQDCKDLLLCGSDNCMYFFSETADCCYDPMPPYSYPGKKIMINLSWEHFISLWYSRLTRHAILSIEGHIALLFFMKSHSWGKFKTILIDKQEIKTTTLCSLKFEIGFSFKFQILNLEVVVFPLNFWNITIIWQFCLYRSINFEFF